MALNIKQNPMFFAVVGAPYIQEKHFDSRCHYPNFGSVKNPWFGAPWPGFFGLLAAIVTFGNVRAG